jgi:phosphatidylglycerophosphate synthase
MKSPVGIQARLIRWTEIHAAVMLAATALVAAGASVWALMALAATSFAALVVGCREGWPRRGRFDAANALTAARLAGVLVLPALAARDPLVAAAAALALFALDGVDGWLARKLGLSSEFGEYFDKEADAFFMLVLCLLLYTGGRLGAWILIAGLLRYGFVIVLMLARPRVVKERRSASGRWIYFGTVCALIAAFTPFRAAYEPFALLMTLLLICSFAFALVETYRPQPGNRSA